MIYFKLMPLKTPEHLLFPMKTPEHLLFPMVWVYVL